jgi:cell division protein ZapA (FtsZ GTPase activity inhibitor)
MSTATPPVTPLPPAPQSVGLQNLLSALRAIGALVGSYLVGHAVFGHTVSADALQVVGGAVLTIASTAWGIVTKTSNIEGIESAARSVISALGGLAVSAGVISGDQLAAILAAIIPLATFVQSALSKTKNQQITAGTTVISAATNKAVSK